MCVYQQRAKKGSDFKLKEIIHRDRYCYVPLVQRVVLLSLSRRALAIRSLDPRERERLGRSRPTTTTDPPKPHRISHPPPYPAPLLIQ